MTTSSSGDCQHPGMSLRTVQVLLWDLIAPKIRSAERDEVKLVLGRTVEENDELFQEANMLGTIMEDLEGNIHESWAKRKLLDTPARAMLERDLRKMPRLVNELEGEEKEKALEAFMVRVPIIMMILRC